MQIHLQLIFQGHIHHRDPICFRAVILANVPLDLCGQWNVTIDRNQIHATSQVALLANKVDEIS